MNAPLVSFLLLRFHHFHTHADVLAWAVIAGCVAVLYALYHLEAFLHLAKYRILTIEERCTAKGGIGLHLLVGSESIIVPNISLADSITDGIWREVQMKD